MKQEYEDLKHKMKWHDDYWGVKGEKTKQQTLDWYSDTGPRKGRDFTIYIPFSNYGGPGKPQKTVPETEPNSSENVHYVYSNINFDGGRFDATPNMDETDIPMGVYWHIGKMYPGSTMSPREVLKILDKVGVKYTVVKK